MRHIGALKITCTVAVFLMACTTPYYERAKIVPGFSGGGGLGGTVGIRYVASGEGIFPSPVREGAYAGLATLYARYGFSNRASMFLQATSGVGRHFRLEPNSNHGVLDPLTLADVQLGGKFKAGRNGAVRVNIGLLDIVDIAYLHDYGPKWTGVIGVGLRGASLGVTRHDHLRPRLLGHSSLSVTFVPPFPRGDGTWGPPSGGVFLGFGLEAGEVGSE